MTSKNKKPYKTIKAETFELGSDLSGFFFSILASQLRADWSVTLDRLDNKYYVTWGSSLTASATPASSSGKDGEAAVPIVSGGSLPPQGKLLGKLDQKDFKQVIAKGMKTYGMFQVFLTNELFDTARLASSHSCSKWSSV